MFTLPRSDSANGVKMIVTATTTAVRSGTRRLAIRVVERAPASPDISPADNGLRDLLGLMVGKTCTFHQLADTKAVRADDPLAAVDQLSSSSYSTQFGSLLSATVEIAENVPWTFTCDSKTLPNEAKTNIHFPYGIADGVAVELYSCTISDPPTCGTEPLAVSRPPSETGRDIDSFADAEWEANPVRVFLVAGTGATPLASSIVPSARDESRGSINVPFTLVADRHLEEHPVTSIGLSVDLLNVFASGTTPQCLLMDPLGTLAEAYIPHGTYVITYTSDTQAYPGNTTEVDARTRLSITGFPPARVNALIVLSCTGELYAPADTASPRAAIVTATVVIPGVAPVVLSLSHLGVTIQTHATTSSPPNEMQSIGYSRYGITFGRSEVDAQMTSGTVTTVDDKLAEAGLNLVMVLLSPRAPKFRVDAAYRYNSDLHVMYWIFNDQLGHTAEMCRVYAPSLVTWSNGASSGHTSLPSTPVRNPLAETRRWLFELNAEASGVQFEGGAVVLRCTDTSRTLVYTSWTGSPWRRTRTQWAAHFRDDSRMSNLIYALSDHRLSAAYVFEPPFRSQQPAFEPFFLEAFTFHVPVAALTYDTAVAYAASHPWPPPGRYVTRYPNFSVQILRRTLDTGGALSPAAARLFPGGRAPVVRRVTVVVKNSALFNFLSATLGDNAGPTGSTVSQIAFLLERRYPSPNPGHNLTSSDVIDAKSVTVSCVSPLQWGVTSFQVVPGFAIDETSLADTAGRGDVSLWSYSSVTVRAMRENNRAVLGTCAVAHFSFSVSSLATSVDDGAYDTAWRARVVLQTHNSHLGSYSARRVPSYVYQFVEAMPILTTSAIAPVGALYTSDSIRMAGAASSVISGSGANMLTFDLLGLNTTAGLKVSVFLPPSIVPSSALCTATAFLADRMTERVTQTLPASSTVTAGPLGSWLNITVEAFTPTPAPAVAAAYRHSFRFQCPYALASPTHLRRSRLPVRAAMYFVAPSWFGPQARLLRLPPLVSRHVRVTSTPILSASGAWTDYRAETRYYLDLRVRSDAGAAEDADIAHALSHLKTISRGFSLTADAGAADMAIFPKHSSVVSLEKSLTGPVAVIATAVHRREYFAIPTSLPEFLRASVRTPGTIRDFVGFNVGTVTVSPRLILADADIPANVMLTCGAYDCAAASRFVVQDVDPQAATCFNIERVDPDISLMRTMWPLVGDLTQATADALASDISNTLPTGTFLPMYCNNNTLYPMRSMVCDKGVWSRSAYDGSPATTVTQCSLTDVCDPFALRNVAALALLNVHMLFGDTIIRVGDSPLAFCLPGRTTSTATRRVTLTCTASRTFALATGESGCLRICPQLAATNGLTSVSYSSAPVTLPASDAPDAPHITGYVSGSTLSVACAAGSFISLNGEAESRTSSVRCNGETGVWEMAAGTTLACTGRCDPRDATSLAVLAALNVSAPVDATLAAIGDTRLTTCAVGYITRRGMWDVQLECLPSREFALAPGDLGCTTACSRPDMSAELETSSAPESMPYYQSEAITNWGFVEGTILTWKCPAGLFVTLNGIDLNASTLQCESNGAWTGSVTSLRCRELCSVTENRSVEVFKSLNILSVSNTAGAAIGDTRTALCLPGRTTLTGTVQLVCDPSRTFALAQGESGCSQLCPRLAAAIGLASATYSSSLLTIPTSDAPGAPFISGHLGGSTLTVACVPGYVVMVNGGEESSASTNCNGETGAWAAQFECVLPCPIRAPVNGAVEFPSSGGPASATYTCNAGYEFAGAPHARSISHECTQEADPPGETLEGWSGVLPVCVPTPSCAVADLSPSYADTASMPGLHVRPTGFTLATGSAYDDSLGRPCPDDAVCSPPAAEPDPAGDYMPMGSQVPLGVVATPICAPLAAPQSVTPWPTESVLSASPAPALRVLRCVRTYDTDTGISSAVWSNAAAAAAAAAPGSAVPRPPGLYAACIESPLLVSATLNSAGLLLTLTFSMPTSKPAAGTIVSDGTAVAESRASRSPHVLSAIPFASLAVDPSLASASTCAVLLTSDSLAAVGGSDAACWWSIDGSELFVALGPNAALDPAIPMHVRSGVITPDASVYAPLFTTVGMTALSPSDLDGATLASSGAASSLVTALIDPLVLDVTASATVDARTPFRVYVSAVTGGASRPLSVQYQLVVGGPGTVTTTADSAAFATSVDAYVARWIPPGRADNEFDGRTEAVTVTGAVVATLTPGQHQLRIEAQSWLSPFGAVPAVETRMFTVVAAPVVGGVVVTPVRVRITVAGVASDATSSAVAEFDRGQQLTAEVALQSTVPASDLITQWTLTPDPGAAVAIGAGALTTARTIIFPPYFFPARTRYTLSLRVVQRVSGTPDTEATATVQFEGRNFKLVASVAIESLVVSTSGASLSRPTVAQRADPVVMTAARAQTLVANGLLPPLSTVALDQLPSAVPEDSGTAMYLDASDSYDPDMPRDSPTRAVRVVEWTCYRVLRMKPASDGGSATYISRLCGHISVNMASLLSLTDEPRRALTRAMLAVLGPQVTDGTQDVTLIFSVTVRGSDATDPRVSQATFAIAILPTSYFKLAPFYVAPLVGAIGSETVAALALRLGLDPESRTWAAIPLHAQLRLRVAVVAPHRRWALRWVCDDCGSPTAGGGVLPAQLDLASPQTVASSVSSDALVISASALSANTRYTFRVGIFNLPESASSFPDTLPPSLPTDGSDPLAGAAATASFAVYTPSAPRGGYCGYELLDLSQEDGKNLLLFCRNWQDEDDAMPFKYRWGYSATVAANPVDALFAVSEGSSPAAGELRLTLAPGEHRMSVEIINGIGGLVRVDFASIAIPSHGSTDPLAMAQFHVSAATDSLASLDATGFAAAVVSAAWNTRSPVGSPLSASATLLADVLSSVSDMVTRQETLWLLTALENHERTVRATGDDTFVIANHNVSALTAIELLAISQSFALSSSGAATPGEDPTAGFDVLAALTSAESSVVTASHAASAALARDVMTNLVNQVVPVTLSSGNAVASLVSTYADVKTYATPPTSGNEGSSVAGVLDEILAPTAAALLLEASIGDAVVHTTARGLAFSFGRVDARAPLATDPNGWTVRAGSLVRAPFPYTNVGSGGAQPPVETADEPKFWLPSLALTDVLSSSLAPSISQPSYSVDVAFASRAGLAVALSGDAQHVSTQPPSGVIWAEDDSTAQQPRGYMSSVAGLTLGRPGSPHGAVTTLPGVVPPRTNGSAPAPPDSASDSKLAWVSVAHEPAPTPLLGFIPYVAECRFFDVAAQAWSGEGCALAASSDTRTWCKCAHLTIFSVRWSPGFVWPRFVSITGGTFDSLTAANIANYPAPAAAMVSLFLIGIVFSVVFFFVDLRYDKQGFAELLATWDLKTQRKTNLYEEFGLKPESSTAAFLWRRFVYVLQRDHLWSSLLFRPRTDNYSSQARAFAVVLMMTMTLVISGALFRKQYRDALILTSVISSVAVYPIVIIWHALFDYCNRDRLKRFVYRYAEEVAYLQLTGTSDFFPPSEWKAHLARRRREIDDAAELIADAGDWRVSPGDVEVVSPLRTQVVSPLKNRVLPVGPLEKEAVSTAPMFMAPTSGDAMPIDPFSVAMSAAAANALRRGYIVRQRANTRFSLSRIISSMSCAPLCARSGRAERRRTLHRVAPLILLDGSHASYRDLSTSRTVGTSWSTSCVPTAYSPSSAQCAPESLSRVQAVSLIAMASAGISPADFTPAPAQDPTALSADYSVQRRALVEFELARLISLVDTAHSANSADSTVNAPSTIVSTVVGSDPLPENSILDSLKDTKPDPFLALAAAPIVRSASVQPFLAEIPDGSAPRLLSESSSFSQLVPVPPLNSSSSSAPPSIVTPSRSTSHSSLALADLSKNLILVRVPYDRETRRQRDRERLHFLLRYSVTLDTDDVGQTYRERVWELSQPRGLRLLAVFAIILGVAACFLFILLIGVELDLGSSVLDARRVSERWVLSALLSIGIYIFISSPLSTLVRSTVTYAVKRVAKRRSQLPPLAAGAPPARRAQRSRRSSAPPRDTLNAFDDCGDMRFDGMPRPAPSRRFSFVGPHSSLLSSPLNAAGHSFSTSSSSRAVASVADAGQGAPASARSSAAASDLGAPVSIRRDSIHSLNSSASGLSSTTAPSRDKPRLYIDPGLDFDSLDGW
jgi:hypothetical protein